MQYIAMYSDIGQKSNTMIFSDRPADVNALMAQASAVMRSMTATPQQQTSGSAAERAAGAEAESDSEEREENGGDSGNEHESTHRK